MTKRTSFARGTSHPKYGTRTPRRVKKKKGEVGKKQKKKRGRKCRPELTGRPLKSRPAGWTAESPEPGWPAGCGGARRALEAPTGTLCVYLSRRHLLLAERVRGLVAGTSLARGVRPCLLFGHEQAVRRDAAWRENFAIREHGDADIRRVEGWRVHEAVAPEASMHLRRAGDPLQLRVRDQAAHAGRMDHADLDGVVSLRGANASHSRQERTVAEAELEGSTAFELNVLEAQHLLPGEAKVDGWHEFARFRLRLELARFARLLVVVIIFLDVEVVVRVLRQVVLVRVALGLEVQEAPIARLVLVDRDAPGRIVAEVLAEGEVRAERVGLDPVVAGVMPIAKAVLLVAIFAGGVEAAFGEALVLREIPLQTSPGVDPRLHFPSLAHDDLVQIHVGARAVRTLPLLVSPRLRARHELDLRIRVDWIRRVDARQVREPGVGAEVVPGRDLAAVGRSDNRARGRRDAAGALAVDDGDAVLAQQLRGREAHHWAVLESQRPRNVRRRSELDAAHFARVQNVIHRHLHLGRDEEGTRALLIVRKVRARGSVCLGEKLPFLRDAHARGQLADDRGAVHRGANALAARQRRQLGARVRRRRQQQALRLEVVDVDPGAVGAGVASLAAKRGREAQRVRRRGLALIAVAVAEGAGASLAALALTCVLGDCAVADELRLLGHEAAR